MCQRTTNPQYDLSDEQTLRSDYTSNHFGKDLVYHSSDSPEAVKCTCDQRIRVLADRTYYRRFCRALAQLIIHLFYTYRRNSTGML